jgi:hypothetical protein
MVGPGAAFSLAETAFQAGLQLFDSISKLMAVSAELRRLKRDLEQLTRIIAQIRDLCSDYEESELPSTMESSCHVIREEIDNFVQDVKELYEIVNEPSRQYKTRINRFKWRVKSVFNEEKITGLSSRLNKYKANLQLALLGIIG